MMARVGYIKIFFTPLFNRIWSIVCISSKNYRFLCDAPVICREENFFQITNIVFFVSLTLMMISVARQSLYFPGECSCKQPTLLVLHPLLHYYFHGSACHFQPLNQIISSQLLAASNTVLLALATFLMTTSRSLNPTKGQPSFRFSWEQILCIVREKSNLIKLL